MKKRSCIVILLVLLMLLIGGCATNITEDTLKQDDIIVWFDVEPGPTFAEDGAYHVHCNIFRMSDPQGTEEFNDALVRVNGITVSLSGEYNGYYAYRGDILTLNPGDEVVMSVSHTVFGKIEETLIVPPSTGNLSTEQDIDSFVNNTIPTITLTWDSVDSDLDFYRIGIYRYYGDYQPGDFWDSANTPLTNTNTITFDNSYLYDDNYGKADYIEFKVECLNKTEYETEFGKVEFKVISPASEGISNLPI